MRKERRRDEHFTSFGTCSLMEDDCGDAGLLDKILLCFLKVQERLRMKPDHEEKNHRFLLIAATFQMELSSAPNPSCNQRSASGSDRCRDRQTGQVRRKPLQLPDICSVLLSPETERGPSGEEDGLGLGFGFLKEPEEGVVLHADLPEDLAAIPAGHGELQRVVVGALLHDNRVEGESGRRRQQTGQVLGLTDGSALSLIRNLLRLKLSLRILAQLKELIFV